MAEFQIYASDDHYADHLEPVALAAGLEIIRWPTRPDPESLVLVASRKDAERLPRVALIEHGSGQWYGIDAGSGGRVDIPASQVVLFVAPREAVAERGRRLYPNARSVIAAPRVEHLKQLRLEHEMGTAEFAGDAVLTFHWGSNIVPEAGNAFQHFQRGLPPLAGWVIGHSHPRLAGALRKFYELHHFRVEWSWTRLAQTAQLLIVDNSSLIWEACSLGIRVLLMNDPRWDRSKNYGLRFWEWADVGPMIERPGDLAGAALDLLAHDDFEQRRAEAAAYVYGEPAGSTERVIQALRRL